MDAVNEEHATIARALEHTLAEAQGTLPILRGKRQSTATAQFPVRDRTSCFQMVESPKSEEKLELGQFRRYLECYPLPQPRITYALYSSWRTLFIEEPYEGNLHVRFSEGFQPQGEESTLSPAEPREFRSDIFKQTPPKLKIGIGSRNGVAPAARQARAGQNQKFPIIFICGSPHTPRREAEILKGRKFLVLLPPLHSSKKAYKWSLAFLPVLRPPFLRRLRRPEALPSPRSVVVR